MHGRIFKLTPLSFSLLVGATILIIIIFKQSINEREIKGTIGHEPEFVNLKEVLAACVQAAELGGNEVRKVKNLNVKNKGKTKEGVNEPVTEADLRSHIAIAGSLKRTFPSIEIISEEHIVEEHELDNNAVLLTNISREIAVLDDEEVSLDDITVWVDPLDATKEFTENLLQYVTTMICVAVNGLPVLGVVHNPFTQETVYGWVGKITSSNMNIAQQSLSKNDESTIIISRSHTGKAEETGRKAFGENTKFIHAAGTGYKILEVVRGRADAYLHVTFIKKWDMCAGNAILHSAGGKMTSLVGELFDYNVLSSEKNNDGLLATLFNHEHYLDKLNQKK